MKQILLLIANFLLSGFVFGQAGTIDLSFNSNDSGFLVGEMSNPTIYNTKNQSDGKILLVGSFSSYHKTAIRSIARINFDGSIDFTFNPGTGANGIIYDLVIQSDGKIIIGGNFDSYNGIARKNIARINKDGSLDLTFNPGSGAAGVFNSKIVQLSIQSDGKIVIGGNFTLYNGISRNKVARLNSDGSLDATFNTGTGLLGNYLFSISLQDDGKIIIGGDFTSYNGILSKNIARINTDGTLDTTFNIGSGSNGVIRVTYIQSDGKIIIGGDFTSFNAISSNSIARLNTNGVVDPTFNSGSGTTYNATQRGIFRFTLQSNGKIIISGTFNSYNGNSVPFLARLNSDGTFDSSFNPGRGLLDNIGGDGVNCISILNDGKILLTGDFKFVNDLWRDGLAFLDNTGLLTDINKGSGVQGGVVLTTKNYGKDKILIGGTFLAYNGIRRKGIAVLNTDGSLESSFNTLSGITNGVSSVSDIEVVGDKIIIVGSFNSYNGVSANGIIRLNSNGTIDNSFNAGTRANSRINTITRLVNNKSLIGGNFTAYNGTVINKIARINFDGSIDNSFKPNLIGNIGSINAIEVANLFQFERYIAGGNFSANGSNVVICELSNTGGLGASAVGQSGDAVNVILNDGNNINYGITNVTNSSFNRVKNTSNLFTAGMVSLNGTIYTMSKQSDGKIIVGGDFTTFNGVPSNYIARLNIDGSFDNSFIIGTGPDNVVRAISIQSDGKIIIGGDFASYNGIGRNRIVRINSDTALHRNEFEKNILTIFPNPSKGYFTLTTDDWIGTKTIEIYNIIGQKIYSQHLTESQIILDLSNQATGVYIYKIFSIFGEAKSGKLIID